MSESFRGRHERRGTGHAGTAKRPGPGSGCRSPCLCYLRVSPVTSVRRVCSVGAPLHCGVSPVGLVKKVAVVEPRDGSPERSWEFAPLVGRWAVLLPASRILM